MKSGALQGFLQLVSANVVTKVLGLVAIGVFTRTLTKDELAILPVYGMITALAHVLFGFGLQPTIIRRLPGMLDNDRPGAGHLIRMSTQILAVGTALFSLGIFIAAPPLARRLLGTAEHTQLMQLVAVGTCCFAWRNICHYLLWSASRFHRISNVRIVAALGRTVFGVTGILVDGVKGLAAGLVVNDALVLVLALMYSRDLLRISAGSGPSRMNLIRESLPFYFESYLTYLRNHGDNWIVATTLGPVVMGIYYVAKRFPFMLMMFMESLDKVVTTELSRRRDDVGAIGSIVNKLSSSIATIAVPAIFMVLGLLPVLIEAVAGPGFEAAVVPGMILCLMQLCRILAVPFSRGVFVIRPPLTRVLITLTESAFLITSLFLLVPLLAVPGVAVGRLIAALATLFGSYLVLGKHLQVRFPWRRLIESAAISTVMATTVLVGTWLKSEILFAPLFALGGVVVFFLLTWLFQAEALVEALDKVLPFELPARLRRFQRRR